MEYEGIIELRHGAGAFIAERKHNNRLEDITARALPVIRGAIDALETLGLKEDEIRRLFDGELLRSRISGKVQ